MVRRSPAPDGLLPLLSVSAAVILVTAGLAHGVWVQNLHNGLLALAFTGVGAYVFHQQPRNRCGFAFLATGLVEAVMFLGRQIGHDPSPGTNPWWGWLGVWPLVIGLFGVTACVILFPDGRVPSPAWRWVIGGGAVITTAIAVTSAIWDVGYDLAGVGSPAPFVLPGNGAAQTIWPPLAKTTFAGFQVLWLLVVVVRWRISGPTVRRQLAFVGTAVAASVAALAIGLIGWGSPTPSLLIACLVPMAAGWAIVHGQRLATHSALTWLGRRSRDADALPAELAAAIGESLSARHVVIWALRDGRLHAVGVWPLHGDEIAPTTEAEIREGSSAICVPIVSHGATSGMVTLERQEQTSRYEEQLLEGYAAQAALVIEHVDLVTTLSGQPVSGGLDHLTPREREVLGLMAKGYTNAAICDELHLSVKTVEPAITSIFNKLGLPPDADSNRRVLAVLAFVQSGWGLVIHPTTHRGGR